VVCVEEENHLQNNNITSFKQSHQQKQFTMGNKGSKKSKGGDSAAASSSSSSSSSAAPAAPSELKFTDRFKAVHQWATKVSKKKKSSK